MKTSLYLMWAAATGMLQGSLSLLIEHPLDVIKTYWQVYPHKTNFLTVVREIIKLKGLKGFYSGVIPNIVRIMLKQAYRYPLMITLPLVFSQFFSSLVVVSIATALSIALIEVWIITPFERLKVWLITYSIPSGELKTFFNLLRCNAFHTLYKGLKITTIRQIASWVTFLVTHDQLIAMVKNYNGGILKLSVFMIGVVSLIEGIINTAVILPLDCIKTNQQKAQINDWEKMSYLIKKIYTRYGLKGFYVGFEVRLIQYMMHSAFMIGFLESLRESFKILQS